MTKPNRKLLITDAAKHYAENKMMEMSSDIWLKMQECIKEITILERKLYPYNMKKDRLRAEWEAICRNMSVTDVERHLDDIRTRVERGETFQHFRPEYYSTIITLRSFPVVSPVDDDIARATRKQLEELRDDMFTRVTGLPRDNDVDDATFVPFQSIINEDVVKFFKGLLRHIRRGKMIKKGASSQLWESPGTAVKTSYNESLLSSLELLDNNNSKSTCGWTLLLGLPVPLRPLPGPL